jgi:hypothetical protein
MIIDNLNIRWSWIVVEPFEADSLLIVNTNAVLPLSIPSEGLKAIPRQSGKVSQGRCRFQAVQLDSGRTFDAGERLDPVPERERLRALVTVAEDHVHD